MDLQNLVSVPVSVSLQDTLDKLQILEFILHSDQGNIKVYKKDNITVTCYNDDNKSWLLYDGDKFVFDKGFGKDVIEYIVYSLMYS